MQGVWNEFKTFAVKGNALDMAVGVIIGSAFGKIISSIVNDIFMPAIGLLLGGIDFSSLQIQIGEASIRYGAFIMSVVDFLIIAFCLFLMVKAINRITATTNSLVKSEVEVEAETKDLPPPVSKEEALLTEIRDLLKDVTTPRN